MKASLKLLLMLSVLTASVLLIGYLDYLTSYEFSLALLYFVPITIAAQYTSIFATITLSVYAGVIWFLADYLAPGSPIKTFGIQTQFWIVTIKIGTLVIVGYTVAKTRKAMRARDESQRALQSLNLELEQRVAERTSDLRKALAEMEHYSHAIVHDMRAPLRAIQGFAELIEQEHAGGQNVNTQNYLNHIKAASHRMDRLIVDALRYDTSVRESLPLQQVNVGALLREMLATYPTFQSNKDSIQLDGTFPDVIGNEGALTQCFSNLLDNAIKFAKPGAKPKIHISAELISGLEFASAPSQPLATGEAPNQFVRISVADDGIGVPIHLQPRIFGMFQRGTNQQEGTGIGLAIVQKVVERMHGLVGVESTEGNGSRFWVILHRA